MATAALNSFTIPHAACAVMARVNHVCVEVIHHGAGERTTDVFANKKRGDFKVRIEIMRNRI